MRFAEADDKRSVVAPCQKSNRMLQSSVVSCGTSVLNAGRPQRCSLSTKTAEQPAPWRHVMQPTQRSFSINDFQCTRYGADWCAKICTYTSILCESGLKVACPHLHVFHNLNVICEFLIMWLASLDMNCPKAWLYPALASSQCWSLVSIRPRFGCHETFVAYCEGREHRNMLRVQARPRSGSD